jgi:lipopolysaccharide export system permease protein
VSFLSVLAGIIALIIIFDVLELFRRSSDSSDPSITFLLGLVLLKLPKSIQAVLPFVMMIGMMFALFKLSRNSELVVIRSAGVSVWQFLFPTIIVVVVFGFFNLTVINHFSASLYKVYERMEDNFFNKSSNLLNFGTGGLWLRESYDDNEKIIHSHYVRKEDDLLFLSGISVFELTTFDNLIRRYEAKEGHLLEGYIRLDKVWESGPDKNSKFHDELFIPTEITINYVKDSFASPETISFWDLPEFINFFEDSGFSSLRHRLYWHSQLASPFFFCSMILLASIFFLSTSNRLGGWIKKIIAGLGTGFMLYFFSKLTFALGLSSVLPIFLSAWAPTLLASLVGLSYLFHYEDG